MTFLSTSPFITIHQIHLPLVYVTGFFFQPEFILKKRIQKICTHLYPKFLYPSSTSTNTGFIFFNRFRLNNP